MTLPRPALPTAGANPGGRADAPGDLLVLQAVVNTRNGETGQDLWADPASTRDWLALAAPGVGALEGPQWEQAVQGRELLRAVLLAHRSGGPPDPAVQQEWSARLPDAHLVPAVGPGGAVALTPSGSALQVLHGLLAGAVLSAQQAGTWHRLKACPGVRCGWAYYDRSPAGRSAWCSMTVCGNRAKARASRERSRDVPAPSGAGDGPA